MDRFAITTRLPCGTRLSLVMAGQPKSMKRKDVLKFVRDELEEPAIATFSYTEGNVTQTLREKVCRCRALELAAAILAGS